MATAAAAAEPRMGDAVAAYPADEEKAGKRLGLTDVMKSSVTAATGGGWGGWGCGGS